MVLVRFRSEYTARKAGYKTLVKELSQIKPRIGQGRAGSRWKKPLIIQPIAQSVEHLQKIPELPKIQMEVINISIFTTLCNQHVIPVLKPLTEEWCRK